MTTPQQRADDWLAVWRELRDRGLTPQQRDRVIGLAIIDVHVAQLGRAVDDLIGNILDTA